MTQIEQIKAEIERLYNEEAERFDTSQEIGAKRILDKLDNFINSLPAEQASEELEEEIDSYLTTNRQYAGGDEEDLWGDDCIRDAIKHGTKWQKEQTINKACEWLNKNVVEYHPRKGELRPIVNINAFRDAMEKEGEQC